MTKTAYLTIFILIITSCQTKQPVETNQKEIKLAAVTMTVPQTWSAVTKQGVDARYGTIYLDNGDSAIFDYGWHSDDLFEWDPTILDSSMLDHVDSSTRATAIFVQDTRTIDRDRYKKNNIQWDTINGLKAKIVFPRQTGIGTIGVYFDSLHVPKNVVNAPVTFSLQGENLKPENEKALLKAIYTLNFPK